jgi:hypothetical protein
MVDALKPPRSSTGFYPVYQKRFYTGTPGIESSCMSRAPPANYNQVIGLPLIPDPRGEALNHNIHKPFY